MRAPCSGVSGLSLMHALQQLFGFGTQLAKGSCGRLRDLAPGCGLSLNSVDDFGQITIQLFDRPRMGGTRMNSSLFFAIKTHGLRSHLLVRAVPLLFPRKAQV